MLRFRAYVAVCVRLYFGGREPRSRTGCVLVPGQAGCRLPRSRWRRPESNRLDDACGARPVPHLSSPCVDRPGLEPGPPPCRGGALPVGASSPGPPRPDPLVRQGGRGGTNLVLFGLCQPGETLRHDQKNKVRRQARLACRYGAHAMEFSIDKPAMRRAGTAGIEPAHAALETAVLPLNYVPKGEKGKEKPPVRFP
jgi:hypothetical protein